eukprot:CAMPEP_0113600462 /NCGR_PEP_ID=MMETSP0015_2-20120614/42716_1 /TAXON_ID=2838 /ORGANISM="Odontella" /LENGTH=982 /DNA_ID=CAMNT_0000508713 /DNA_START=620 /DNA_END=3568 /DNA_ORIENTATION=+ /assembly_acc=CAM_ASM_000160
MSDFHKRMRRGSVNKNRFPPPPAAAAASSGPIKPNGENHRQPLFELRRGSDKENNAPLNSTMANGAAGGGSMGLLIPMLGRDDDVRGGGASSARRGGGARAHHPPQLLRVEPPGPKLFGPADKSEEGRPEKRDSISSVSSGMSLCFDEMQGDPSPPRRPGDATAELQQRRLETVQEKSPPNGVIVGRALSPPTPPPSSFAVRSKPPVVPRPARSIPSIPPRLGSGGGSGMSPPKVSLSRRPTRVAGFKRRDITPPAPLFDAPHLQPQQHVHMREGGFRGGDLMTNDGDFNSVCHGSGMPASPAKALRMSSFSTHGPSAPGLSSLFGDETASAGASGDGGDNSSPSNSHKSPETASPRKLPFSLASSSTPRASPMPADPYPSGGARGLLFSPHWSHAVHINPFSPVPSEYLGGNGEDDHQHEQQSWAPPIGSTNGMFYSPRGSPLRPIPSSANRGVPAAAANKRKTPRRPIRTQHSDPLPGASSFSSTFYHDTSLNFDPDAPVMLSERRDVEDLAIDTSMESVDGDDLVGVSGHCRAKHISPTDVASFPPPPTPAKKAGGTGHPMAPDFDLGSPPRTSGRPMPDFGSPPRSGSSSPAATAPGSPLTCRKERRPPPLHRLGPGRSFDLDDDLNSMISPHPPTRNQDDITLLRSPMPQCNVSRFEQDFQAVGQLGTGSFGTVHKVISRLDGCLYAVKVMKRPVRGELDRRQTLKEVHALAALCSQSDSSAFHIVRYHQAWMEENLLHIQTELCTSTLPHEMAAGMLMDEDRRFKLLREMLLALELIHRNEMVHLDIKPENIFIKNDQFKLGDFGLASKLTNSSGDVEEGDSRYMSRELLSGETSDLTKCDMFSLGATMYEVCLGRSLPADGPEWVDLRSGKLAVLRRTHPALVEMVRDMMGPDPVNRPCASALLRRRQLLSDEQKLLLLERNRAREASLALVAQERKLKMMNGNGSRAEAGREGVGGVGKPNSRKLTRSTSCSLY